MKVTREGIVYEAWQWDDQFSRRAPRRVRNAICTRGHYGSNAPHVHTLTGWSLLKDGDWILLREDGQLLCFTPGEFAAQCDPIHAAVAEAAASEATA